jgi:hypothetical protein
MNKKAWCYRQAFWFVGELNVEVKSPAGISGLFGKESTAKEISETRLIS